MTTPSGKHPILILTSAFGEGHNAAARNLAVALRQLDPDRSVEVRDLFAEAYGPLYKIVQSGYFLFINHLPALWSWFFKYLHRSKEAPGRAAVFQRAARLLRKTISDIQPAVVASTYPGYNHLLDHLEGGQTRSYRTVTVVTDSISINSLWHSGHSDLLLVPNEITGLETLRGQRGEPDLQHLPKVLYLVNPGQKNAAGILRQLASVEGIELSAACGRDEQLRATLQKLDDTFPRPIRIEGWMPDLPDRVASSHLVIAKAGGATVQECLAAGTPLILSQIIPGQEEGNAELLTSTDCGCTATSPQAVASAVRYAFSHGASVWKKWEANAMNTGKPEGARNSAKAVLQEAELES